MIYNMVVEEHLVATVRVNADSYEEAVEKVENALNNEEIVLTADHFTEREVSGADEFHQESGLTHDKKLKVSFDLTYK